MGRLIILIAAIVAVLLLFAKVSMVVVPAFLVVAAIAIAGAKIKGK